MIGPICHTLNLADIAANSDEVSDVRAYFNGRCLPNFCIAMKYKAKCSVICKVSPAFEKHRLYSAQERKQRNNFFVPHRLTLGYIINQSNHLFVIITQITSFIIFSVLAYDA